MSLTFLKFADRLGVKLTPAQCVLCAVAFDGVQPKDLDETDRALARQLFGDVETVPPEVLAVLVAVCGARAGKTYVLIALRMLHLALTVPLTTLAPGEVASAPIVAPDLRLARQALRYVAGAVESSRELSSICSVSADSVTVRRDGHAVVVECLPATSGGSAVRGRSLVGAGLDESAFFRDKDFKVNDSDLYKALAPRVMPGGQLIVASTPWAESGLLYELFRANHGKPTTALAVHAPTTLLRPDKRTARIVEQERQRDPDNAAREFDAEFMAAGSGLFFDGSTIDRAFQSWTPSAAERGCVVAADLAFTSDFSSFCAVRRDGGVYRLVNGYTMQPKKGAPLKPTEVMRELVAFARHHGAQTVWSDVHYQETVREALNAAGLSFAEAPAGQPGKLQQYAAARALFQEGRVMLPPIAGLPAQLKAVVSKPQPGGTLKISSPRRAGSGHGDTVSALVLALWAASQEETHAIDWDEHQRLTAGSSLDSSWGSLSGGVSGL